jgi:ATP-dependent DNA helicase DinG
MSSDELIASVLGDGGAVARALGDGYEARPEQMRVASAVRRAMLESGRLVVEAGTGVGKSFAYLTPAIERAVAHGERVVVSTHTISLQEQLVSKDIPLLRSTLGEDGAWGGSLRPVLVKGRGNYLSLRRLKLASERALKILPDAGARRSLHQIEDWAYDTEDGTLSTVPPLERPGVWDRVQSDSGNCMGRRCPTYQQCFYQSARREMESANLLVCNHALFFSDLAMRHRSDGEVGFLPRYQHVVLDEAHTVEEVAAEHFGLSLTEGRVRHLLSTLYSGRTGKGYLAHLDLVTGDIEPIQRAVRELTVAEEATGVFFDRLIRLVESGEARGGRVPGPESVEDTLSGPMNALARQLRRLKDDAKDEADRFELNAYAMRAAAIADAAEGLCAQTVDGCCYWIEIGGGEGGGRGRTRRRVTLACAPVEVGPVLKDALFDSDFSVTMTSATLATRTIGEGETPEHAETAFAHFLDRAGAEGAETLQLGSPFDHVNQVELYVDTTMPEPGAGGSRARGPVAGGDGDVYARELVTRLLEHIEATGGGAFVLFTSFSTLNRAAGRSRNLSRRWGIPCSCRGRGPRAGRGRRCSRRSARRGTACCSARRASGRAWMCGARRCGT